MSMHRLGGVRLAVKRVAKFGRNVLGTRRPCYYGRPGIQELNGPFTKPAEDFPPRC